MLLIYNVPWVITLHVLMLLYGHAVYCVNRTFPDDQLALQFASVGASTSGHAIEERSALNVFSPSLKYGTR